MTAYRSQQSPTTNGQTWRDRAKQARAELDTLAADMLTHGELHGTPAPVGDVWDAGFALAGMRLSARRVAQAWLAVIVFPDDSEWPVGVFAPNEAGERQAKAFAVRLLELFNSFNPEVFIR